MSGGIPLNRGLTLWILKEVEKHSDTRAIWRKIAYYRGSHAREPSLGDSLRFKKGEPSGNVEVLFAFKMREEE
jgi:hypothetical protein